MSEGQLKKHATPEEFDAWFKSLSFYERIEMKKRHLKATKELYKDGYLNALEDFKEWIDEAKKDIMELIVYDALIHGEIIISDEDEMIKRLKKWFGESE